MNRRLSILLSLAAVSILILILDPWPVNQRTTVVAAIKTTPVDQQAGSRSGTASTVENDALAAAAHGWPARALADSNPVDIFTLPNTNIQTPVSRPIPPAPIQVVPPPAIRIPTVPQPPRAPPVPFVVLGDWSEGSRFGVFLGSPSGTVFVQAGDTPLATYRIDAVSPGVMRLTYLPLNQSQQLTWSSTQ